MLSGYEKVTNVQYIPVNFLMKNIPAENEKMQTGANISTPAIYNIYISTKVAKIYLDINSCRECQRSQDITHFLKSGTVATLPNILYVLQ
jgi:hypothetical protein